MSPHVQRQSVGEEGRGRSTGDGRSTGNGRVGGRMAVRGRGSAAVNAAGRGGGAAGRGGGGRGPAGRGAGRGHGHGRGRGVQQVPRPQVQLRLFQLKQHLVLKCFNYLDEASRVNVFQAMGWPTDNYFKRKEAMIKHQENMEAMRQKRLKEEEEAKVKREPEESENKDEEEAKGENADDKTSDGREGETKNTNEEDAKEGEEETKDSKKEPLDLSDLNKLAQSINAGCDDADAKEGEEKTENKAKELAEASDSDFKGEIEAQGGTKGKEGSSDDNKMTSDVEAKTDDGAGEVEAKTRGVGPTAPPKKEVLPPLVARVDPDTLLERLNTRRLYQRVLYYTRKNRKKLQDAARMMSEDGVGDGGGPIASGTGGIGDMYEMELKDKRTADRVYRKGMAIQEMADKEWDELVEVADLRNVGNGEPFHPIPTQYELLLFQPCPRAVGILASYPRSGNSLMRTLYEHTTLRVTGSDMQGGLAKHDLVGEMAVGQNKVQFVKTHYPERQGHPPFRASRVVLLVRNPFDAIESFFNLMMTGTHTASVTPEVREKTVKYWEEYVQKEIRVWKGFHSFWMNQDLPILLIRYEDLIRSPDKVMGRVLQFVLEVKRMGTFFTERINRCIQDQAEIERMGSYKPRSGGIGKSMSKYSPELFAKLREDKQLKNIMTQLGYNDLLETPPNEWATKLEPLKDHATEYLPSWEGTGNRKVVLLNQGKLARGPNEVTKWQQIKVELGIVDKNWRMRGGSSGSGGQKPKAGDNGSREKEAKVEGNASDQGSTDGGDQGTNATQG